MSAMGGGLGQHGLRRVLGLSYDDIDMKCVVWNKAQVIPGRNPDEFRRDDLGNVIRFQEYGMNTPRGWHYDHFPTPAALGGSDEISNLRPLHWRANTVLGGLLGGLLKRS